MVRKSEKILKVDLGIFNVIKVNKKKDFVLVTLTQRHLIYLSVS